MNIYVGNLSFSSEQADLENLFQQFGEVSSAKIIMDNFTGRSKGFGFVIMDNDEQAREAIEKLNGHEMAGNRLTVNEARPRENNDRRGGGGGGFNRGGGGYGGGDRRGGGGNNYNSNKRW